MVSSNSFVRRPAFLVAMVIAAGLVHHASAQNAVPRISTVTVDPYRTLEDQLLNRLRATSREQRAYLQFVVKQVKQNRLDMRLVIAIQRYALRRRPDFPFPFFEQALRTEAAKRNVILPRVQTFASSKIASPR
ncbi:hypothetical protein [Planctomycetes bacterium K23_9]